MTQYFARIEDGKVTEIRKTTQERINAKPAEYPGTWVNVADIRDYPGKDWLYEGLGFEQPITDTGGALIAKIRRTSTGHRITVLDPTKEAFLLETYNPSLWSDNPIMVGDQWSFEGKLWESLVDYNVWVPPVGWREVVTEGYPDWVQPTGAHDAYDLGERVTHNTQDWESQYASNVWEPGVFGWITI